MKALTLNDFHGDRNAHHRYLDDLVENTGQCVVDEAEARDRQAGAEAVVEIDEHCCRCMRGEDVPCNDHAKVNRSWCSGR